MGTATREWFEVDKKGLGNALAARGIEFAIGELVQNAWDADGITAVSVKLEPVPRRSAVVLSVEDDSPGGFASLSHAYRLFGGSTKANDPTKRGKWDLGEKLVFALALDATVESTSGTIRFDAAGRHRSPKKRERGSLVTATLPMSREDLERCKAFVRRLIPPTNLITTFDGFPLAKREPLATVKTILETEIADENGKLRHTWRETDVHVHRVLDGEKGTIYELGLPVEETGDEYHYDIQQRIPVGFDRDSVTAYYLGCVRAAVLNAMHDKVTEPTAKWVSETLESSDVKVETVRSVVTKRFGEKAVAYDLSDVEAVGRATAAGYTVVHGGSLSSRAWESVRKADALPRAGKIFPSTPKVTPGTEIVPPSEYTAGMKKVVAYAKALAQILLGVEPPISIVRNPTVTVLAQWSHDEGDNLHGSLTLNLTKLGVEWFDPTIPDPVVELLLHEFAHSQPGGQNHLSDEYHNALCRLGAKMRRLGYLDQL